MPMTAATPTPRPIARTCRTQDTSSRTNQYIFLSPDSPNSPLQPTHTIEQSHCSACLSSNPSLLQIHHARAFDLLMAVAVCTVQELPVTQFVYRNIDCTAQQ